jgi:hypothetical protein
MARRIDRMAEVCFRSERPGAPALTHPILPRRAALLLALLAASCATESEAPSGPSSYPPLDFSYLLPLRLNVASVEVVQRFVPSGQLPDVSALDPIQPVAALRLMAEQRLKADGTSGRAVFVINDASMLRLGDLLTSTMAVEVDIIAPDNTRAGYAQATVVRQMTGSTGGLRAALYRFTREMLDQMNIEFEYQVRRSLANWLLPSGAVPSPVQTTPLPPESPPAPTPPLPAPTPIEPPPV